MKIEKISAGIKDPFEPIKFALTLESKEEVHIILFLFGLTEDDLNHGPPGFGDGVPNEVFNGFIDLTNNN